MKKMFIRIAYRWYMHLVPPFMRPKRVKLKMKQYGKWFNTTGTIGHVYDIPHVKNIQYRSLVGALCFRVLHRAHRSK
jgi:hypothetical protein